jgi:CTP synthase
MGNYICKRLQLGERKPVWTGWKQFVQAVINPANEVKVALVGKYAGLVDSYVSMNEAFRHAGAACQTKVSVDYIEAETFEREPTTIKHLKNYDGIFIPYGFGPRGTEGKMKAVQYARENDVPFLGICYGFQLAVIEFARHVCGLENANSTEINPNTLHPVIDLMPEQITVRQKGATMRLGAHKIMISKNTMAHKLYGKDEIEERHRHRWEVNPEYWDTLNKHGMIFSAKSEDLRRMEILELPDKFYFFASQYHGEFKSRPSKPDGEYYGFVKACLDKKLGKAKALEELKTRA